MSTCFFQIDNLNYIYESSNRGITNISFSINQNDFIALIGENGAGKSTLINLLLGVLKKSSGQILVDNDLTYQNIGYSTQTSSIDWYLNVEQNIKLSQYLRKEKSKDEFNYICKILDVENIIKESLENLSGGQQQRVQIARALLGNPLIYILDEPTTGLDAKNANQIFKHLKSKTDRLSAALVSSHDLNLLEEYCNKVLLLEDGAVKYFGTKEQFLREYELHTKYFIKVEPELTIDRLSSLLNFDINWSFKNGIIQVVLNEKDNIGDVLNQLKDVKILHIESEATTFRSIVLKEKNTNEDT